MLPPSQYKVCQLQYQIRSYIIAHQQIIPCNAHAYVYRIRKDPDYNGPVLLSQFAEEYSPSAISDGKLQEYHLVIPIVLVSLDSVWQPKYIKYLPVHQLLSITER